MTAVITAITMARVTTAVITADAATMTIDKAQTTKTVKGFLFCEFADRGSLFHCKNIALYYYYAEISKKR
jgi:hypothetical protein